MQQIADILGVKRGTLYGHLDKAAVGTRLHAARRTAPTSTPISAPAGDIGSGAGQSVSPHRRVAIRVSTCPTCGNKPSDRGDRWRQRQDLAVTWLYPDPADPQLEPVERVHCAACQPTVVCELCGDGPLLVNDLAAYATTDDTPPAAVRRWLNAHGWQISPKLICPDHHR